MLSINTAFLIWANDDLTKLVETNYLSYEIWLIIIQHWIQTSTQGQFQQPISWYLVVPHMFPLTFNHYMTNGNANNEPRGRFRKTKFVELHLNEWMKSSAGKPKNPPTQHTETQISPCWKSQGLISFNNRRGCCAEGLHTNQGVHGGTDRGTQLETERRAAHGNQWQI